MSFRFRLASRIALPASIAAALATIPAGGSAQTPADEPPAAAESGPRWFPENPAFAPLLAAPREVDLRAGIIAADRPDRDDFEGTNAEADVAIGRSFQVIGLLGGVADPWHLTIGFETGVFARFFLETDQKDLINLDFRVGVPMGVRKGPWEGRLTLLHMSSHLGDDFLSRFDLADQVLNQVTRDGFELLLARRFEPGIRLYAGSDLNFHVNSGVERTALRWGSEWDPAPAEKLPGWQLWPFVATDFQVASTTDEVAGTGIAGLALRLRDTTIRLQARGHFGPSALGRFRLRDETLGGIDLRMELR